MAVARRLAALALALTLVTAGCLGGGGDGSGPQGASPGSSPQQAGNATGADGGLPSQQEDAPTLQEPPDLEAGDWWEVSVESPLLGETYSARRVVTGTVGGNYRVGLAPFTNGIVFLHLPGVGNVRTSDLSFDVHGERFTPLDFPLKQGKTWTTSYLGTKYQAKVNATEGLKAEITYAAKSGSGRMAAVYDAEAGALTKIEGPLGTKVTVTGHGENHTGEVVVPYDRAQVLDGRFAAALTFAGEPAPPVGSIEVPSKYDRASVGLLLGSVGGTPGYYRESAAGPNGSTWSATSTGEFTVKLGLSEGPSGTWDTTHVTAGAGFAATELILYKIQKASLPAAPAGG